MQTFALPLGYHAAFGDNRMWTGLHPPTPCSGAVDETRTRDLHLGKVALYQLSYYRTECCRTSVSGRYCITYLPALQVPSAKKLERVMGIEPTYPAWKAGALPLSYTRIHRPPSRDSALLSRCRPSSGAGEETRTHTSLGHQILNLARLPFRHARASYW